MISSQNTCWEFLVPVCRAVGWVLFQTCSEEEQGLVVEADRQGSTRPRCTQRDVLVHPEPSAHRAGPPAGVGRQQGHKPGHVSVTMSPPCSRAPPDHRQSVSLEKATLCVCLFCLALPGAFVVPWGRLPAGFVAGKKRSWRLEASKVS